MSIRTVYLFHEGKAGGYDQEVLKKIPFEGKTVIPQPFGGKGGHSRYMDGYASYAKSLGTTPDNQFIGFRDRDFDFAIPEHPQLISAGNNVFAGYRTTIENYLFDYELFYDFTESEEYSSRLGAKPFQTVEETKEAFDNAAEEILFFQAARNALGCIRNPKAEQRTNFIDMERWQNSDTRIHFFKSGTLPQDLTKEHCIEESYRVIDTFQDEALKYSREKFAEAFEDFLNLFNQSDYIEQSNYLIYVHGKDFEAALKRNLSEQFPFKTYYRFAIDKFDYLKFQDLVELKEYISNL